LVPDSPVPAEPATPAPAELWWQPLPSAPAPPLCLELWQLDGVLRLRMVSGDLSRAPRGEVEALLLAIERLILAAADGDLDEAAIGRTLGLTPLNRGPDWVLLDSCWVELPEVRRVVGEALGSTVVGVFATGADQLVAYLYGAHPGT